MRFLPVVVETSRRHCSLTHLINETFYSTHDDRSCNRSCKRREKNQQKRLIFYYRDSDRTTASFKCCVSERCANGFRFCVGSRQWMSRGTQTLPRHREFFQGLKLWRTKMNSKLTERFVEDKGVGGK